MTRLPGNHWPGRGIASLDLDLRVMAEISELILLEPKYFQDQIVGNKKLVMFMIFFITGKRDSPPGFQGKYNYTTKINQSYM